MHSRTLYQTESLELLRLNYHYSSATFLDPSAPLLLSYVRVTAGSSTLTRPASLQAWLMFAQTVEWHHTLLNICSSALPTRQNPQLKTYKTIQTRWLIFSSSTTTNEGEEMWATTTTTTTAMIETNHFCNSLNAWSTQNMQVPLIHMPCCTMYSLNKPNKKIIPHVV